MLEWHHLPLERRVRMMAREGAARGFANAVGISGRGWLCRLRGAGARRAGLRACHCWAHTKRKYDGIAEQWPVACAEIGTLISELCRPCGVICGSSGRAPALVDRIWQWATVQVGLPRGDFGKAVRYMLKRWAGLTASSTIAHPLENNAAERALRGPSSVARTTTAHARGAVPRSRPSFTRSAKPRGSSTSIPTRISCAPSRRRSSDPGSVTYPED